MIDYKPNPIICLRAVELWVREIQSGRHDNGDTSKDGLFASMMASTIPSNADDPKVIAQFRVELYDLLMCKTRFAPLEDAHNERIIEDNVAGSFNPSLHTDYHPDAYLDRAMKRSGLQCEMPWKSHTYLDPNYLSARFGYSADELHHYPLDRDGRRWAVTTLYGNARETKTLIESVQVDNPLAITIDDSGVGIPVERQMER